MQARPGRPRPRIVTCCTMSCATGPLLLVIASHRPGLITVCKQQGASYGTKALATRSSGLRPIRSLPRLNTSAALKRHFLLK
eukprot:889825-Amphidinium_carterae.1